MRDNRSARRVVRGFMLLEALVALLIFSFGVLGVVGLQAAMAKAQTSSKMRADAAYLAHQLVGAMWSDVPNLGSYATAQCAGYARCADWSAKVTATLPAATPAVAVDVATGVVTVRIDWTPAGESRHSYSTETALRR